MRGQTRRCSKQRLRSADRGFAKIQAGLASSLQELDGVEAEALDAAIGAVQCAKVCKQPEFAHRAIV